MGFWATELAPFLFFTTAARPLQLHLFREIEIIQEWYLVVCAFDARPAATLAFDVLFGLGRTAGPAANRFDRSLLTESEEQFCVK